MFSDDEIVELMRSDILAGCVCSRAYGQREGHKDEGFSGSEWRGTSILYPIDDDGRSRRPDEYHGTRVTYNHHHCRCRECREACRLYVRGRRMRRKVRGQCISCGEAASWSRCAFCRASNTSRARIDAAYHAVVAALARDGISNAA